MDETQIREGVLGWTNGIRSRLGLPRLNALVPGVCKDAGRCVIAASLIADAPMGTCVEVSPADEPEQSYVEIAWGDWDDITAAFSDISLNKGVTENSVYMRLPTAINQFALDFDARKYPDLVRPGY